MSRDPHCDAGVAGDQPRNAAQCAQRLEERVKRFYNNFAVTLGIVIGFILGVYFFTFSELVDKAPPIVWKIQALTTVLMVLALIYIKRVSFFATRLWLGRRPGYQPIFVTCRSAADLEKSEEQLLGELQR